jgi:UDP-N-acetylglucosamine--N-acetylmuramyl-(pentapeptide) pyrophosphoryl-undecaprenol N-acetylglucosamine transferase
VRPEDLEQASAAWAAAGIEAECAPYFEDLPRRIADAHLVIARSGASTMAELAAIGRPAVLVPFAAATNDHQTANARVFLEAGAGTLLPEPGFTPESAASAISGWMGDEAALTHAASAARGVGVPDAAAQLADLVEKHLA